MTRVKTVAKIANGKVKHHFLHLAASIPRIPVTTVNNPARIAIRPKKASGDGNSPPSPVPIYHVSSISSPKYP